EETKAEYTDDIDDPDKLPRKFYVDNVTVAIATQLVYELDPNGKKLRVIKFTDYTREQVTSMFASSAELRSKWSKRVEREAVIAALEDRGIAFESLIEATGQAEADPFDLLCHVAFNAPLRTRRERAERLKKDQKNFFDHYAGEARAILLEVLDKYIEHGTAQFKVPDILKVEPVSNHGNVIEITTLFGGPEKLRDALSNMQNLLYAA
ncbi:MAG: DEAD/DEAH box helicase, partial [Proteobacteria bacterium]|nr:DEAD/DEAH box helicase [Pseudomonadota bacterium]